MVSNNKIASASNVEAKSFGPRTGAFLLLIKQNLGSTEAVANLLKTGVLEVVSDTNHGLALWVVS